MKQNNFMYLIVIAVIVIFLMSNQHPSCPEGKICGKTVGGITRTVSSTQVAPGSTFTVSYTLTGGVAPYYYIIRDTISSGGCTIPGNVDPKVMALTLMNPATSFTGLAITAPSSPGSCTLSGFSKLGTSPNVNFPDVTITIANTCTPNWQYSAWTTCSAACSQTRTRSDANNCPGSQTTTETQGCSGGSCVTTCTETTWQPEASTVCSGTAFTQYKCQGQANQLTQSATGTKSCTCTPSWSCGAWSDAANSCGTRTCTDAKSCNDNAGKPATSANCPTVDNSCETRLNCEVYQECNKAQSACTFAWWVWAAGGLLAFMFIMNMMSSMGRR